jgi:hypothetical protein
MPRSSAGVPGGLPGPGVAGVRSRHLGLRPVPQRRRLGRLHQLAARLGRRCQRVGRLLPGGPAPLPASPAPLPASPAPLPASPAPLPASPAPLPASPAPPAASPAAPTMLPANASGQSSPRSAGHCEHRPWAVSAVRRQCDGDASGVARPCLPIGPPTARRCPRARRGRARPARLRGAGRSVLISVAHAARNAGGHNGWPQAPLPCDASVRDRLPRHRVGLARLLSRVHRRFEAVALASGRLVFYVARRSSTAQGASGSSMSSGSPPVSRTRP